MAAALPYAQAAAIRSDLERSTVSEDTDGEWRVFHIAGYERPRSEGRAPYVVDGEMLDRDDAKLSVVLHSDENGRLFELEIIRWADGPLIDPDWTSFRLARLE